MKLTMLIALIVASLSATSFAQDQSDFEAMQAQDTEGKYAAAEAHHAQDSLLAEIAADNELAQTLSADATPRLSTVDQRRMSNLLAKVGRLVASAKDAKKILDSESRIERLTQLRNQVRIAVEDVRRQAN